MARIPFLGEVTRRSTVIRPIRVSARRTTGQTLTSGALTTIIFNTVLEDNYRAYNSSTGVFTCPFNAFYQVWGSARDNSTTLSAAQAAVLAGGTAYRVWQMGAMPNGDSLDGTFGLPLLKGNTIEFQYLNAGASSAIDTFANLVIIGYPLG